MADGDDGIMLAGASALGRRRETREPGVLDVWVVPSREAVKKKEEKKKKRGFFSNRFPCPQTPFCLVGGLRETFESW